MSNQTAFQTAFYCQKWIKKEKTPEKKAFNFLMQRPFTPATPVRLRLGTPNKFNKLAFWVFSLGFMTAFLTAFSLGFAADPWSKQDIALEATYFAFHLLDWGQTRDIAIRDGRYHELNPILGKHPSLDQVNLYFLGTGLLHPVITNFLPKKYRSWFQGVTIGISGACVIRNFNIGLRINF